MSGVNKVIIIGNVGDDPKTNYLPSGDSLTNISVATSESWKDKKTGDRQEKTEWHRIVFFGKLAEIAAQYLRKGSKVYVEGSLKTRKYQAKDGSDRYSTDIIARNMEMLDGKSEQPEQQQFQPRQTQQQQAGQYQPQKHQPQQTNDPNFDKFDEDIPF